MTSPRAALVVALLLGLSGCGSYDPPAQGDHAAKQYQDDLEQCSTSSTEAVRLKNAATPGKWILSPFTGPSEVRAAIRKCMTGKGYVIEPTSD